MARLNRRFGRQKVVPIPTSYSSSWTVDTTGWLVRPVAAEQGDVPTGFGLQLGSFTSQTDWKQSWPDGSMRYGILSCNATSTGVKALTVVPQSGVAHTPVWPSASVTFSITSGSGSGNTYVATLPTLTTADPWLSGPNCVEYRARVTPVTGGSTAHDNLRVLFDVRSFLGGGHRLDIIVENCRDNALMNSSTYTATIAIGGSTVYNSSDTDWTSGMTHFSFTAWHKSFFSGITPGEVTVDFTPFYDAKLLYRPMAGMVARNWAADSRWGSAYHFGPLRFGFLDPKMNAAAGRPELSPIPMWDLEYLATQDAENFTIIKQNADALSSWTGGRVWANDNTTMYKVDDGTHNSMTLAPQSSGSYPSVARATVVPTGFGSFMYQGARDINAPAAPTDENQPRLDPEHPPDCSTVYAVTGDRFYAEQIKQFANWWLMLAPTGSSEYETGMPYGRDHGSYDAVIAWGGFRGTVRGWSRPLRLVVQAANLLPDADPDKQYLVDAVNDNLAYCSDYNTHRTTTGDPYHDGALFWESLVNHSYTEYNPSDLNEATRTVVYHQAFAEFEFAHTIWWANHTGQFTVPAGALSLCDRMVQWQVSALSTGSDAVFPRPWALNAFYPAVGERDGPVGSTVTLTSGLANFAERNARDIAQGGPFQAGIFIFYDLVCNNSTTVSSVSMHGSPGTPYSFASAYVGMPIAIGGQPGSNWVDDAYVVDPTLGNVRVATPGIYTIVSIVDASTVVLDRKPVTNGTSATAGHWRMMHYPSFPLDYNGSTSMLGIKVAVARGLTGAATALAYAEAYESGGVDLNDILKGTNGGGAYGYVGYGLDLT